MPVLTKYPSELKERAVRLVLEARKGPDARGFPRGSRSSSASRRTPCGVVCIVLRLMVV